MMKSGSTTGRAATGGGGSGPASGTVILGTDQTALGDFNDLQYAADLLITTGPALTATWAESAGTATLSKIVARITGDVGGNLKACLYGSDNALIATSQPQAIGAAGSAESREFVFSSPPTLTKGASYRIGIVNDTMWCARIGIGIEFVWGSASGSYASPPASIATHDEYTTYFIAIWGLA